MDQQRASSSAERIKALEITRAYAEFKTRQGDLGEDLVNWTSNIMRFIEKEKAAGGRTDGFVF